MASERTILTILESAYYGTGGFEFAAQDGDVADSSATSSYLVKHPREHIEDFAARCKVAYYLNYMAPCVDAHVAPLFRRAATRDAKAQARGEDAPLKTDDHTQDRHRYALYNPSFKPDARTSAQIRR